MRALVTGGAGFIGSNLVHELVAQEWEVDIVDDMSNGHLSLLDQLAFRVVLPEFIELFEAQHTRNKKDVYIFECDFAHKVILDRIKSKKYDVVFHQAAIPRVSYSVEHPVETTETNILKSVALLHACVDSVKRVVIASSSSVYGGSVIMPTSEDDLKNPKSPYALQKSVVEEFSKLFGSLYGLDTVNLRYFNVFGPGQNGDSPYSTAVSAWCDAISHGKVLRSDGDGSQSRDLCYVDNVVSANILAANSDRKFLGNCYNICCGDRTTNREILKYLISNFDNVKVNEVAWRAGDVMHTQGDWLAAFNDFGYVPLVKFWDGLQKTLSWWNLTPGRNK